MRGGETVSVVWSQADDAQECSWACRELLRSPAWPLRPGQQHYHPTIRPQRVKVPQSIELLGHPQEAETEIVAATAGRAAEVKRQPAAEGGVAPATGPNHAERARGGACRIYCSTTRILLANPRYSF